MAGIELIDVIEVGHALAEGIQWNESDQCIWWTDIQGRRLHRWSLKDRRVSSLSMPERVGSFAFTGRAGELLVAFESGIARYHLDGSRCQWLARPEPAGSGRRFNDGRADRQGRFWAGTMIEDSSQAAAGSASLYKVDHDGEVSAQLHGMQIANGLCFSPDSRYCYVADSPRRLIYRYRFDPSTGVLGESRVFAETPPDGVPDGATIDTDGCMWSAHWGRGQVVRYTPNGEIDLTIPIPARQPTCCAFGGPDLDLLFVTSAREGLSAGALQREPQAGHVFVFQTGHQGLAEPTWRGH